MPVSHSNRPLTHTLRHPASSASWTSAYRESLNPDHILYGLLSESSDVFQERLRSRCPPRPAARNLLNNLARLGIHASKWRKYK